MYRGAWARRFVRLVQREGGLLTLEDLAGYSPTWPESLSTTFLGHRVNTVGLPSSGGRFLIEGLNLLEVARPDQFGRHAENPKALFWTMQCARMSYLLSVAADDHVKKHFPELELTPESRLRKKTARSVWKVMREPGWMQRFQGLPAPEGEGHSDGVIAVDPEGNIVALTHSINTSLWGSTGIFVDGVSIPDSATFQQKLLAKAGPGGHVENGMNPLIVRRNGRPILAGSCVGGGLHEATLQNVMNVLVHGLNPKQAVESPAFGCFAWSGEKDQELNYLAQTVRKGDFAEDVLEQVRALGQPIEEDTGIMSRSRGYWIGVRLDPKRRLMEGAVAPDLNGWAIGS